MSRFLDLDEAEEYSPSLAFRNQQNNALNVHSSKSLSLNNSDFNRINDKPSTKFLDNNTYLPTLQKTNDLNNSHSMTEYLKNHQNQLSKQASQPSSQPSQPAQQLSHIIPASRQQIQSPIVSRLKSPATTTSPNSATINSTTTTSVVPRLNNIDLNSFSKKMIIPKPSKFFTNSLQRKSKSDLAFDTIPNTISMESIEVPKLAIKAASTSTQPSVNLGFINLTSDDDDEEDDDDNDDQRSSKDPIKYKSQPKPFLSSIETNAPFPTISSANEVPSFNSSTRELLKLTSLPSESVQVLPTSTKPLFTKFSYNDDSDADKSDSEDDVIITGVTRNTNNSFQHTSDYQNIDSISSITSVPATNALKRERVDDVQDETVAKKRQEILQNKMNLIQNNFKKEENIQKDLITRANIEKQKQEQNRINKLLEKYPPIKALPQKYQIHFPKDTDFIIETEPVLPAVITENEIRQEQIGNIPEPLRVSIFRNQHRTVMHSIIHRLNKFKELHSKMDFFLKNVAKIRDEIHKKAQNTKGLIKADIRYNQILRFIDIRIRSVAKYYGEIGLSIDRLQIYKNEILLRAKKAEDLRKKCIFQGFTDIKLFPVDNYLRTLPELNLIINAITEMYRFSDPNNNETLSTIRAFSLTSSVLEPIPIPQVKLYVPQPVIGNPILSSFDALNPIVVNDDDSEDDEIFGSSIPFGRRREENFMPFSNVYDDNLGRLNPYGTSLNDSEGIKNLMESIKVIEFEEEGLAKTPGELCISLLKHQRIGLSWMLNSEKGSNKGGILADDMGLGKTVQAISLILANKSADENLKTTLVVGPVSLLHQWQQEISMKIQTDKKLSVYLFHSTNKVKNFKDLAQYDIVLVSYQTLGSQWKRHYHKELEEMRHKGSSSSLSKKKSDQPSPFFTDDAIFHRIILDEAQYIKNKSTIASKAVASLSSSYRWCLSGTPIQNKIEELYPLIRFLGIQPYNDWTKFNHQIVSAIKRRSSSGTKKIHAILSAILLRRTKDSEIDGKPILTLPEKHLIEEEVEMDKEEKEFYSTLEHKSAKTADKLLNSGKQKAYSSILTLLLRMRQACDHEYLVRLGDDGDRTSKLENFQNGFQALKDYSNAVIAQIENEKETGFICINCKDELAEGQVLLLSKCGHPICYDCHSDYFEENSESSWEGTRSAKCAECGVLNLSSMSVDLKLFEAYQQGYTWQQIRKIFDLDSKAGDKNWRKHMLEEFIKKDGKLMISAKIKKTLELIEKIQFERPDEKIIIFSQFLAFFDVLKIKLNELNLDFLQYDGSMDMTSKNDCITAFYKEPTKKILLLSLKAGNVGLTLTCANHVIIAEPFWNPYVEKQAQDRVHRISQTKEVYVHRLLIKGTIEDRIMELQRQKEELVESALDPTARSKIGKLSRRELGFLFGLNGLSNLEDD